MGARDTRDDLLGFSRIRGRSSNPHSSVADALPVLGVVDHGFRTSLSLQHLESKATIEILRRVLDVVELFGKPKTSRTDTEAMVHSRLWRLTLHLLRRFPQRIAPMAPWQNGHIERFFGTFKAALRRRKERGVDTGLDQANLDAFRAWNNAMRPHQNLGGLTPAEAWNGKWPNRRKKPSRISGWSDALTGFYWRPG